MLTSKPRLIWDDNIKIDLNIRNWIDSVQDKDYWRAIRKRY